MSAPVSSGAAPACSVVVPVYNEQGNVVPLFTEIHEVMSALGRPFEVIFVNDGSTDATLEQLRDLGARHPELRILDLDGNFGEAGALSAGFRAARGPVVITLDGDGQNDPHDIPRLLESFERDGYRVVSGWRRERQEGLFLRVLPSRVANGLIAAVTRIPVHDTGCGLKVYRREVVQNAQLPRGMNRFLPAILGVTASDVAEVPVDDRRREHGASHYGLSRTLIVMRDLLALRCIMADPTRSESVVMKVAVAGVLAHLWGDWTATRWLSLATAVVVVVAAMIWGNLRRFNRAQREGAFRVRREYSAATRTPSC
jgi:glycosyltransferase involved in cell wall biosynthesis